MVIPVDHRKRDHFFCEISNDKAPGRKFFACNVRRNTNLVLPVFLQGICLFIAGLRKEKRDFAMKSLLCVFSDICCVRSGFCRACVQES